MAGLLDTPSGANDLTSLLAQFQPSQADMDAARKQAQLQFFLGLLGAPKGGEFQRIGQSGLLAMNSYQDRIKQEQAMRGQNVAQAAQVYKLLKDAQFTDMGMGLIRGDGSGVPTGGAMPAPSGAMPSSGGVVSSAMGGATTTPLPAPQAPVGVPSYANPRTELGFALAGKKDVADVIHRQYQVTQGPGGTLIRNGQVVGQVIPNAGMVIDGQFQPLPKEATDALINFSTAQKRGEVQAQAEADLIPVPIGNGQTKMMTRADAARLFSQQPSQPAPSEAPADTMTATVADDARARQLALAADRAGQPVSVSVPPSVPGGGMGGLGVTPNPLAMKRAEADIATNQSLNTKLGEGVIGQLDKNYEVVNDIATKTIPSLQEAHAILDSGKVMTGAGANFKLEFGRWLSAAGMGGDDYVNNTQAFLANQAKQVMSVVKQLGSGSGISNSDREYAARAQGGQIEANEQSIRRIIDIGERAGRLLIQKHNDRVGKAANSFQRTDLLDLYSVPMPDIYQSATQSGRAPMIGPNGSTPAPDYSTPAAPVTKRFRFDPRTGQVVPQ